MLLYNSLLVIMLMCEKIKISKLRKMIYYSLILILSFLNIFRHSTIGNDTGVYIEMYKLIKYKTINNLHVENGYFYYNKILHAISSDELILLIFSGIIIFFGFYIFIKKNSINIFFSLYIFIGLRYYGSTMNIIRQMIAISFIFLVFEFIKKLRLKKALLLNIIAIFFHKSAIVFLFIILLVKVKYNKKYYHLINILTIIIFMCSNILLKLLLKISFFSRYNNYLGGEYLTTWNFGSITQFIIALFVNYYYYYYYIKNNKKIRLKDSIYGWISSFSSFFSACAILGSLLGRIALYFSIFNIVIIPLILRKNNNKYIYYLVIIFIYLYHYFTMKFRPEWNYIYPYKFYWN